MQRNRICEDVEVFITNAAFCRDRSSNPNIIRRTSRTGRVPTRSIILIVRPPARHAGDIRGTLNRLSYVVVRVRDLIVIANRSIGAHAFDQVDGFLAAPTDRPMTIAACGHKDRFALGCAVGVSHGKRLAPVDFGIGAAGCDICAAGCYFAG